MLLEYTTLLHCCNPRFTYHHHGVICSNICQLPAPLLIRYLIFITQNVIPYYGCGRVSTYRSAIHGSTSAAIFVCICLAGLLSRAELLVLQGGLATAH